MFQSRRIGYYSCPSTTYRWLFDLAEMIKSKCNFIYKFTTTHFFRISRKPAIKSTRQAANGLRKNSARRSRSAAPTISAMSGQRIVIITLGSSAIVLGLVPAAVHAENFIATSLPVGNESSTRRGEGGGGLMRPCRPCGATANLLDLVAVFGVVDVASFFGELHRRRFVVLHRQSGKDAVTTLSS